MFLSPFTARADATPPAGGPVGRAAEPDRLAALLDAVGRLADQQRSLLDALRPAPSPAVPSFPPVAGPAGGAVPPSFPPAFPAAPAGPRPVVSADDVRAVVAEALQAHAASAARDAYARDHLADLPEAYRRLLPAGGGPPALAAAEQAIRRQFRDDLRAVARAGRGAGTGSPAGEGGSVDPAAGGKPNLPGVRGGGLDGFGDAFADVGGDDDPVGRPPAAAVDYAKLSPLQQIAVGLRGAATRVVPAGGRSGEARAAAGPAFAPRPSAGGGGGPDGAADADDPHEAFFVGAD